MARTAGEPLQDQAAGPTPDVTGDPAREVAAVEQWFVRRGIPHFIDDYRAGRDIWTRAAPVLPLGYVAGALNGANHEWSALANVGAVTGAVALLLLTWVVANVARHRPPLARPTHVGAPELAVFVLGPSVPPLVFGGQWRSALVSATAGLAVLLLVYVVTSYGLVPMTRWALGRLWEQLHALGNLFVRALPLLLVIVIFTFLSTEAWQVAATLDGPPYPAVIVLFVGLGGLFVLSRVPEDVRAIGHFESWDEVRALAARSPGAALVPTGGGTPDPTPANWRQWLNVALVLLFTRAVQITLVALSMGAFLVLFGFLAIPADLVHTWTGTAPHVLATLSVGDRELALTEELLRVGGFLAAFTGLYFTVYVVTDATYREEFKADVVGELREAFAVRAVYLDALARRRDPSGPPTAPGARGAAATAG